MREATQRGGYNREVEWYLTEMSRLVGERSSFPGLVAVIERGGSGGCSGTKGCGMIRVEPFENAGELSRIHRDFDRANACEHAWRHLSTYAKWLLAARYCYTAEKLPPGLHGQLGDLSAVAFVVCQMADDNMAGLKPGQKRQVDRLIAGAGTKGALLWAEKAAGKAMAEAHALWEACRAHAEVMAP